MTKPDPFALVVRASFKQNVEMGQVAIMDRVARTLVALSCLRSFILTREVHLYYCLVQWLP